MRREHGTPRGYRQHRRRSEQPCPPCAAAYSDYQSEYRARRATQPCAVSGCELGLHSKGLCKSHYERLRRGVQVDAPIARRPRGDALIERLRRQYVIAPNGCWQWTGSTRGEGYGRIAVGDFHAQAHRVSYELLVGPIPSGLELDHLCRNRACVNPDHLEPVTHAENGRRGFSPAGINYRKTHCKRGHPLEGDNLRGSRPDRRECYACKQLLGKLRYAS